MYYNIAPTGTNWLNYISGIEYETNGVIYARLTDDVKVTNVITGNITNIDKLEPKEFSIEGTSTTNSIAVGGETEDQETTEEYGKSEIAKYYFSKDDGITWEPEEGQEGTTYTWNSLPQNTNYTLKMKAVDNAGNEKESIRAIITTGEVPNLDTSLETGNITFTYTPSSWTNGNVVTTISTTVTGFTLQYSRNGTTWTNCTSGVEYTANGYIYARLWDGTNASNVATGNITNIDKLQPNTFTIAPTSTTNSITCPVPTVTDNTKTDTNGSSGIAKIEYKLDTGTYSESTRTWTGLTQGTNHTVYVRATDNSGNTREVSKAITVGTIPNLDTDLETGNITFTYTPSSWTNGNVVTTISTTVTGFTLQYSKDGATWINYLSGVEYTANGYIYARLWDGTNASNVATGNVTNIDKEAPTVPSVNLNGYTSGTWTSGNVTQTLSSTDSQSGINRYQYSHDQVNWYDRSFPWTINWDEHCDIYTRAVDNAGNVSGASGMYTIRRDTVRPSISTATATTNSVTFTGVDNGIRSNAGISQYCVTTSSTEPTSGWTNISPTTSLGSTTVGGLAQNTTYYIWLRDQAGNTVGGPVTTGTVPVGTGNITFGYSTTNWTNGNVTVTLSTTQTGYTMQYSMDGGTWTNYTTGVVFSANGPIYARLWDGTNVGTTATGNVSNIDKEAPTVPSVNLNGYTSGSWTNGNVTQTFSSTDSQSGINRYECSHDGVSGWYGFPNPETVSWDGQWNFYIRAVDNVGNVSGVSGVYTIRRDTTAPSVSTATTTTNSVTFTATDVAGSGINQYCVTRPIATIEPTSGWKSISPTTSLSTTVGGLLQDNQYYLWIKDVAGNVRREIIRTGAVPVGTGNITFGYSTTNWTSGNVRVTLSTAQTGYTMQYSMNGGTWTNYTTGVVFTANGTINARLWDGVNASTIATGSVNNIDKTPPVITTIIPSSTSVTFTATTDEPGAKIIRYGYTTSPTIQPTWTVVTATNNLTNATITGLQPNTKYYIYVYDQTGTNYDITEFTTGAVLATSVTLNKSSTTIQIGATETLTATVLPTTATNRNVTWSSSNTSVATVNASGVITAVSAGTTTITATAVDGSGKSASCTVTVPYPDTTGPTITVGTFYGGEIDTFNVSDASGLGWFVFTTAGDSGTLTRIFW